MYNGDLFLAIVWTLTYDWSKCFNPFTPEPPVTACADPGPF